VTFQVFLMSAAVFLALGNSPAANQIAVYAFYALLIGIAIQIGVVVREERKRTRAGRGTNPQPS